jgi:large subunit ribosomal protein L31
MKQGLHPQWYPEAKVFCACGESWTVGATVPEIRTDVCSKCHPFYTGEQRIVDTEGQVERFMRRLQAREKAIEEAEQRKAALTSPEILVTNLELGKRLERLLTEAGMDNVGQVLTRLEESGDEGLMEIKGFGLKALADLKKGLRAKGFILPGDESSTEEAE